MRKFKKSKMALLPMVLFLMVSFATAHKFYVSVTNINYSEDDAAFQITSRIFIDDLDKLLKERYGIEAKLATPNESKVADEYIEKYFRTKFLVELDGETCQLYFSWKAVRHRCRNLLFGNFQCQFIGNQNHVRTERNPYRSVR